MDDIELKVSQLVPMVRPCVVTIRRFYFKYLNVNTDYSGTGFCVHEDGLIVTNAHVLENRKYVYVVMDDDLYLAYACMVYPRFDLAFVKIYAAIQPAIKPIQFGDSEKVELRDAVFTIGSPGGVANTVNCGYIEGIRQTFTWAERLDRFLVTSVLAECGNSGAPLLNMAGYAIGVVTGHLTNHPHLSMAIPLNRVDPAVKLYKLTCDLLNEFGIKVGPYYQVTGSPLMLLGVVEVMNGSHAKAEMALYDRIIAINGKYVLNFGDVMNEIRLNYLRLISITFAREDHCVYDHEVTETVGHQVTITLNQGKVVRKRQTNNPRIYPSKFRAGVRRRWKEAFGEHDDASEEQMLFARRHIVSNLY
ncbi:Serine protease HTRA4 [Halotydeus destructor]|nr:Serine protease HTRA4 [Halotydeus destructor]